MMIPPAVLAACSLRRITQRPWRRRNFIGFPPGAFFDAAGAIGTLAQRVLTNYGGAPLSSLPLNKARMSSTPMPPTTSRWNRSGLYPNLSILVSGKLIAELGRSVHDRGVTPPHFACLGRSCCVMLLVREEEPPWLCPLRRC